MRTLNTHILLIAFVAVFTLCVLVDSGFANQPDDESARQLRIYKDALLRGGSEQIRVDAAVALLLRSDPEARAAVLEVLSSDEEPASREAVCQGLIASRAGLANPEEFMEPLIGILVDEEGSLAKLAAESLTMYEYSQVADRLTTLIRSSDLDRRIRLNAVYALRLRPDKGAVEELIRLLDDPDQEVAVAAEKALQEAFGYPVGTDRRVWQAILEELPGKSRSEIMKDHMVSHLRRIAELQQERDRWKTLYLEELEASYARVAETGKTAFLVERFNSPQEAVRLWALEKVMRVAGNGTENGDTLHAKLLELISDPQREVRLKTAKVLSKMSAINPGPLLLEQLKVEEYADVRLAIFEALGEATYFAFSPGSRIELPETIRLATLDWAKRYLESENPQPAAEGAEVVGKLLSLNGLSVDSAEEYLQLLALRFDQATQSADAHLRSELLGVMSRLCSHGTYRDRSAQIFWGRFLKGVEDTENDASRRSAVLGLIRIDKAAALEVFRNQDFYHDSSAAVRLAVMELAGEVGGVDDLGPLMSRLQENGDQDVSWKAFVNILSRQKASVSLRWGLQLRDLGLWEKAEILVLRAEKMAEKDRDADTLVRLREFLAEEYALRGEHEKAVLYYMELLATVFERQPRAEMQLALVQSALACGQYAEVAGVISERLRAGDISIDDEVVSAVGSYFDSKEVLNEPKVALSQALAQIPVPQGRPIWIETLRGWQKQIPESASAAAAESPVENPG